MFSELIREEIAEDPALELYAKKFFDESAAVVTLSFESNSVVLCITSVVKDTFSDFALWKSEETFYILRTEKRIRPIL